MSSWLHLLIGGLVAAVIAAGIAIEYLRRKIGKQGRRIGLAEKRATHIAGLLSEVAGAYWVWRANPTQPPTGDPLDTIGSCSASLAQALGVPGELSWHGFRRHISDETGPSLDAGLGALHRDGEPFEVSVETADGKHCLRLAGRRTVTDDDIASDIVWACDDTGWSHALGEAQDSAALLRKERESFESVLDALPIPVWRRRRDLSIAWCNSAYGKIVGRDAAAAAAAGRELAPGAIERDGRGLAERAQNTRISQSESHTVVVSGARRLFEITEQPVNGGAVGESDGADGTDPDLCGFALDYTNLEEIQDQLARHVAAHGEVLERLGTAIAIFGSDTRLKFFNRSYTQLWGLDEGWLALEPSHDEVLEALRERRRLPEHADFKVFKKEQLKLFTSLIEPAEELLYRPDDTTVRVVVSPHPLGGLIFVFEDVTDRLALERSYHTLNAVQEATINNLHDGVAVFGSDGRLSLANPAIVRLWQMAPEDIAGGAHISDLVEKTKRFFVLREDWNTLKPKIIARVTEPESRSGQLERTDGSVLSYACVPLPDGACLLTYGDVTDSFRVERALRERNEALEAADGLKTEFIANVSYELRTPLNAIIGFDEILHNEYFGTLNDRQKEYSQGILDSSQQLLSLINDILDLASIEAGYMRLERAPVDLQAMLRSIVGLTRERARELGLNIRLECAPQVGQAVVDERRLKQAIFNLISNALKFTPEGGTVTIEGRRETTEFGDEIVIDVRDTGTGIPADAQDRIFEKFERGHPQARQSGAGLGLSLVKSLIELHGGAVHVESQVGEGTMVSCRLPTQADENDAGEAP